MVTYTQSLLTWVGQIIDVKKQFIQTRQKLQRLYSFFLYPIETHTTQTRLTSVTKKKKKKKKKKIPLECTQTINCEKTIKRKYAENK